MYHIGKTLFLISEKSYLYCDDATILIQMANGAKHRLGYDTLSQIVIFYENTTLSAYVMNRCAEHKISIHYVSVYGRYLGSFMSYKVGNVCLRKLQFDMIGTEKSVMYVRNVIAAKCKNSIWLLQYFGHHSVNKAKIDVVVGQIRNQMRMLKTLQTIDDIRLLEMNVARLYFSLFDDLIKINDERLFFDKRTQHPPLNCFNALLSFFYTMLTTLCESALLVRGLDSECGYLHTLRSGRCSLACDLIEEFRACIVDRFVLTIVNRKEVCFDDFINDNGRILLTDNARKNLLVKWDNYLNHTVVKHQLYGKDVSFKMLVYEQAQFLAQYIRGDIMEYPPFYM